MVGRIQFLFCFCIFNFCIFPVPVILLLSNLHMAKVQQGRDLTCVLFLHLLSVYCPCLCRSQPREIYHSNVLVMPLPAAAAIVHIVKLTQSGVEGARLHHKSPENHNSDCLENVKRRRECDINQAGSCQSGVGNNLWPGIVGG